jgi:hypothetical protein
MSGSKNEPKIRQLFIFKSEQFVFLVNSAVIVAIAMVLLFSIGMIRDRYAMGIGTVLGSLLILWVLTFRL